MLSLGIDIGGTKAHAVVLDDANEVVAENAVFTKRGSDGVRSVVIEVATSVADQLGVGLRDFDSVGIGIPGVVNREAGEISSAVNLRIERMPLRQLVADSFAAPVRLDNDVKATVVAAGMLLDSLSVTYVNFGTGLASATLAGRLIRGNDNAAGEIGHFVVNPNGDPCRCGQRGCLETVVGGAYLAPRMELLDLDWTTLDGADTPTGWAAYDQAVRVIAQIVTLVSVAYASEHIVLGGGVIQAAPWALTAVKSFLIDRGQMASFPDFAKIAEQVIVLDSDMQAPAIGAALIGQGWTEGYKL
ncbi:MAG: ROK family protein [Propionibacteriaceae bacterium]|jgi:predicted NBD/HSP70 family sugar kinase|nr:ROK family protein [Propionibacteriaceae bacterium]